MFNETTKTIEWCGHQLELSTGKFARQTDGAVMVRMGKAAILCTAVAAKQAREDADFFPLTINYQEKTYAAGKIPGGFLKREGKGSEKETLISRLIDRPIRPLFHSGFFNETQVICTVHSFDTDHPTDILALIGASACLAISGLPYQQIVAASRVGMIDGELVINPSYEELKASQLDLVVAGTKDSVMMVESEASFLTEQQMLEAVKAGHEAFQPVINMIEQLKGEVGKPQWEVGELYPASLKTEIEKLVADRIVEAFKLTSKQERYGQLDQIMTTVQEHFAEQNYSAIQLKSAFEQVKSQVLRQQTLNSKIRIDGRKTDQVRAIASEVSLFGGTHGSALFTRGETQALVSTTLGTGYDEQIVDNIEGEYKENFLLNYIFLPYSVGEVGPIRAPSRREIGHGKLAWRALKAALPDRNDFPYTLRLVSEITESNGSSSMATVCGGTMAMLDAGVPLTESISGIAMGLIKEQDQFVVLSDIIADEDHLGDMDFKVAGSRDGVTALQMDIKVAGITFEIMEQALQQAKAGRVHILDKMAEAISTPNEISDNAPIIESFPIKKDKIRDVIGPGGKIIREICDTTGAKIDISDEGLVVVAAVGKASLDAAVTKIKDIAIDPEIGEIFTGTVVKVLDAGAFINYLGARDGFVHISEIANERIETVESVLQEGQQVRVKLIGYERGKAKLTIKNVDNDIDYNKAFGAKKERSDRNGNFKKSRNPKPNRKFEYADSGDFPPHNSQTEKSKKWNQRNEEDSEAPRSNTRKYFT